VSGLSIGAAAMGWIAVPLSPGVPNWIAGLSGAALVLAGIAVALPQRSTGLQNLVGALLLTAFATMWLWIGLGPGQRNFGGGASVGPIAISGYSGETIGRIAFGAMGIVVALMALAAWRRLVRGRKQNQAGQ
jgi:hypothetical protein